MQVYLDLSWMSFRVWMSLRVWISFYKKSSSLPQGSQNDSLPWLIRECIVAAHRGGAQQPKYLVLEGHANKEKACVRWHARKRQG